MGLLIETQQRRRENETGRDVFLPQRISSKTLSSVDTRQEIFRRFKGAKNVPEWRKFAFAFPAASGVEPLKIKWTPLDENEKFFGTFSCDGKVVTCDLAELSLEGSSTETESRTIFALVAEKDINSSVSSPSNKDEFVVISLAKGDDDEIDNDLSQILSYHIDVRRPKENFLRLTFQCG